MFTLWRLFTICAQSACAAVSRAMVSHRPSDDVNVTLLVGFVISQIVARGQVI
jgi:hypothetical protein